MARWVRGLVLAMGLSWMSAAQATTGLVWTWEEDSARRYFIEAELLLPELLLLQQAENVNVRVSEVTVMLNTMCRPDGPPGKKTVVVHCTIDDVRLVAAPVRSEVGRLLPILDEMDAALLQATVELTLTRDGRVRGLSLQGMDDRIRRLRQIQESLRQVMLRAFASLDLSLPKKADDEGRSWRDATSRSMGFVTNTGTYGKAELVSAVVSQEGDIVQIDTQGQGIMVPGDDQAVRTPEGAMVARTKDSYDMSHRGTTRFDVANGHIVERMYRVDGVPTASSQVAEGGAGVSYVQSVRLKLVSGEMPALPPNGELAPGGARGF
jgi:hypothetical protein